MNKFTDLSLTEYTLKGLDKCNFVQLTPIQNASIPLALDGYDILGSAKTGSGKTLAFLIPILEILTQQNWDAKNDGLGALIIAPTRELAMQIFAVLRKIGYFHPFSAGLITGGKSFDEERRLVGRMNILIATPGRLLQHLEQSSELFTDNLKVLVLDEADRILDLGFSRTINAIIESLPKTRQTLLFSATQTKSVKDLARLSLHNPRTVDVTQDFRKTNNSQNGSSESLSISKASSNDKSVSSAHNNEDSATPVNLLQYYTECPLPEKVNSVYSFVKSHLKSKIIVFVSSCKQVRFLYEVFCKLHPGIHVLHLHGKQKQAKRSGIFAEFCRKKSALLIATDVAARGLDFPLVDWVVQMDCPDDVDTYIHRVGRTARYEFQGNSLLLLLPSEKTAFLRLLSEKKIPIEEIDLNPSKLLTVHNQLSQICAKFPEIKYLAQRSIVSYARSIYLNGNKNIFKVSEIPFEDYAIAIGLPTVPTLKFVKSGHEAKNTCKNLTQLTAQQTAATSDSNETDPNDDAEDDEIFKVARRDHDLDEDAMPINTVTSSKKSLKLQTKKKVSIKELSQEKRSHVVFDEEGDQSEVFPYVKNYSVDNGQVQSHLINQRIEMSEIDSEDKQSEKERKRQKRFEKKMMKMNALNE